MVGSWELENLTQSEQFFAFARAYMQASARLSSCFDEVRASDSYPHGCVILFLAVHSVELFLKGAILAREPSYNSNHHVIDKLKVKYYELYTSPEFQWNIPFITEFLGFDSTRSTPPKPSPSDQVFRYPTDKKTAWPGVSAYAPQAFQLQIGDMQADMLRIEQVIVATNKQASACGH